MLGLSRCWRPAICLEATRTMAVFERLYSLSSLSNQDLSLIFWAEINAASKQIEELSIRGTGYGKEQRETKEKWKMECV